jgi:hypothetical protein
MKLQSIAAALAGCLVIPSVQAGSINDFLFGGAQLLSDNSAEYQSFDADGDNALDEGDRLRGIFDIGTTEQGGNTVNTSDFGELTGLFEVEVKTKLEYDLNPANPGPEAYQFIFIPYSGFATELVSSGFASGDVTGAAVAFFLE